MSPSSPSTDGSGEVAMDESREAMEDATSVCKGVIVEPLEEARLTES